jgi:uncharacterized membrane protein
MFFQRSNPLVLALSLCLIVESGTSFAPTSSAPLRVPRKSAVRFQHPGRSQQVISPVSLSSQSDGGFPDVPRPDPSILVSAKSDSEQRVAVIAIGAGIVGGTFLLTNSLFWFTDLLPFLGDLLGFVVPVPLGLLLAALGATHFVYKDGYVGVVPPNGTWGDLWNIPAPGVDKLGLSNEEYHTIWTGVAEIGGGLLFALGGLNVLPIQIPAFLMFLLTLAVTPANIYMFTHDAQLTMQPPIPYPEGHIFRGVAQCVVLSLFWYFTFH